MDGDGCDNDCTYTEIVIDVSWEKTCAIIEGGRVRCWGANDIGQLGLGHVEPIGDNEEAWEGGDIMFAGEIGRIGAGDYHMCGVFYPSGDVTCWGDGSKGTLGYVGVPSVGDMGPPTELVQIGFPVDTVVGGECHTCALGTNGSVGCWGTGPAHGYEIGTEVIGDDETPVEMGPLMGLTDAAMIASGFESNCIVNTQGHIRCWGRNWSGQLGLGHMLTIGDDESPMEPAPLVFDEMPIGISMGFEHTCALFDDGTVRCWGAAGSGQLGQGNEDDMGDDELATDVVAISLGGNAVAISSGDAHNCVLFDDGRAKCWGAGSLGQLGIGSTEDVGDDELPSASPTIGFDASVRQIEAGGLHTCAVLEDYRVYCWGYNSFGQLGLGHTQDSTVAVDGLVQVLDPA